MTAAERKALQRELRDLRRQCGEWKLPTFANLSHIDYCLQPCTPDASVCHRESLPMLCEGCLSELLRRERRDEIIARALVVKRLLVADS